MISGLPVAVVRSVGCARFVRGLMLSGRVTFVPTAGFGGVRAMVGIRRVVTRLTAIVGAAIRAMPRIVGRVSSGVVCRGMVVRRRRIVTAWLLVCGRSASFVGTVWAS